MPENEQGIDQGIRADNQFVTSTTQNHDAALPLTRD